MDIMTVVNVGTAVIAGASAGALSLAKFFPALRAAGPVLEFLHKALDFLAMNTKPADPGPVATLPDPKVRIVRNSDGSFSVRK